MGLLEAINIVGGAGNLAEMHEAADVVILVKGAEDAFGGALGEPKIGEWRKKGIAAGDGQIFFDNLLQRHGLNDPKSNILSFRGKLRAEESLCGIGPATSRERDSSLRSE